MIPLPLALLLAAAPAPAVPQADYEAALERCEELERRLPLRYHVRGWGELAATHDPRAIEALAGRYAKPARPKDQVRYLLASVAARKGAAPETVAAFDAWRAEARAPEDAWLWVQALGVRAAAAGPEELVRIAREEEDPFLRGAAVEALAARRDPALATLIPELARALPKKPAEQCALVGALATGLSKTGDRRTRATNEWQQGAFALVALLEREDVPRPAKLVIARHLAAALDAEKVVLEAAAWRSLLAGKAAEARPVDRKGRTVVPPRFFGVEASGERICYVVDLSDSMCTPLPAALKERHGGPPVTGGGSQPKKKEKGALPSEDDIPWALVNTRFDLAREHIKVSLRRLSEEQGFCVVVFGDRAELLDGLKGMTRASGGNVKRAIKALDEIEIGSARPDRPHGTLRGATNLHAGLKQAFAVQAKGLAEEYEYVALDPFLEGCDTIFLLSDGDPTWDDYEVKDVDYGDGTVGDPESRDPHARTPELIYPGPYATWDELVPEVRRMNLFREVEIHCVAIGEVNSGWLKQVADLGLGTLTKFD